MRYCRNPKSETWNLTVGLLGGSFNPAHEGHLHLSEYARKSLGLDQVWWLVSPGNPLKPGADMAPYRDRLASARAIVKRRPHIHVSDIERRLGTRYSFDTLRLLQRRFTRIRFVWLMGADNLHQFHRWRRWREIFRMLPLAVFDRAPYSHRALRRRAPLAFARFRRGEKRSPALKRRVPPAWCFIHMPRHPASSSAIRRRKG